MEQYDMGVVLTYSPKQWESIVPGMLIHTKCFEDPVAKMINRQLAFMKLCENNEYSFRAVAIILDEVQLNSLNLQKFGNFNTVDEFAATLNSISIHTLSRKPSDFSGKIFPMAWEWSKACIGRKQIARLAMAHSRAEN
jgi:hypothetical protein